MVGEDKTLRMNHMCHRAVYYVDKFFRYVMALDATRWYEHQIISLALMILLSIYYFPFAMLRIL